MCTRRQVPSSQPTQTKKRLEAAPLHLGWAMIERFDFERAYVRAT
jgi:hypothetical protein